MADLRGDVRHGRTGAYDPRSLGPWAALVAVLVLVAAADLVAPRAAAAPAFTLTSTGLEGGVQGEPVEFSLAGYRGHPVVLDLMAVSCGSCRAVTDDVLLPLWRASNGTLAIVSIDAWSDPAFPGFLPGVETAESLRGLQRATGVPWRHALDTDRVWEKYGVTEGLPRVVVVDGLGRIAAAFEGVPALSDVQAALRGLP